MKDFATYHAADVRALLDYPGCIEAMRQAMAALSADSREQPLRSICTIGEGQLFGLMPGMAASGTGFGAKLVSVFRDPEQAGRSAHKGLVALFENDSGDLLCVADAHEITKVRTACASAAATDTLARPEAETLAVFGYGTQAESHVHAIPEVRPIRRVLVWGRSENGARAFAERMAAETGLDVRAEPDARAAAAESDIVCTVTGAAEPILLGDWVQPGTHINAVGSSFAGPMEIEPELVAASAYFVDYRRSALAAAAELLVAMERGLVGPGHIRAEIGEVLNGSAEGRRDVSEVTLYKSLGHVVQDLAAAHYVHTRALSRLG